jgi:sugar O-acyltransferase (sialic acid O-acetyltransferase NeuD family)
MAAGTTARGRRHHDEGVGVWIVGIGGVGRESLDVALAAGVEVAGFLDDRPTGEAVRGLPVLEPKDAPAGEHYVIGIADPHARRRLAGLLDDAGLTATTLVHPRAVVAPETTVAPGCVVMAGAHVSSSVTLGAHVQVHYNATVGHDAVLGPFTSVYPGANVGGATRLEEGATVGSGAVVLQGRLLGAGCLVGAGAVVTRDVPPGATVAGVTAAGDAAAATMGANEHDAA